MNGKAVISKRLEELQMVSCIKGIRGLTGWGLRDSKYFVDEFRDSNIRGLSKSITFANEVTSSDFTICAEQIRKGGLNIHLHIPNSPVRKEIHDQINATLSYATLSGQYDLANALMQVLEVHYPQSEPQFNEDEEEE